MFNLGDFISKSRRIFHIFYKPKYSEFMEVATITGIGMILVGLAGYIVYLLFNMFKIIG